MADRCCRWSERWPREGRRPAVRDRLRSPAALDGVQADLGWSTLAEGRRIHDLRHTAACLWLARGVDPGTVQAWMGHASIATTNLYLHHLGTPADRAGLERLNARGTPGAQIWRRGRNDKGRTPPNLARLRWSTGFPSGGEGIRTPDLLIANETRYQLRHSPEMRTKL